MEHTQALFDAHDKEAKRSRSEKEKEPDPSISVAIAHASVPEQRGTSQQGILLLAATLTRDGTLEPDLETGTSPWVPAERLVAPGGDSSEVVCGSRWRVGENLRRSVTFMRIVRFTQKGVILVYPPLVVLAEFDEGSARRPPGGSTWSITSAPSLRHSLRPDLEITVQILADTVLRLWGGRPVISF